MPKVSKTVFISRPPNEVFEYLANFENTAEWDPGVAEAKKVDNGPARLGSTYDLVALFRGRRVPVRYETTVFEPNTRVVLVGRNKRFTGTDDIGVEPDGDGSRVFWNADFQMRGIARVLQPFMTGIFEKLSVEAMDGLEATLGSDKAPR